MTPRPILEAIREAEILGVVGQFSPGAKILELGGGNGFQAQLLTEHGLQVTSIDLGNRDAAFYPVQAYDGHTIPFADSSFDCVFSSNVLEHIPHLGETLREIRRVLKPGGIAVHVLPSPAWRLWTTLAHYPRLLKVLGSRVAGARARVDGGAASEPPRIPRSAWSKALWLTGLEPHGEYPNAVAELYYFSQRRWYRMFEDNGFRVESALESGLFYTGQALAPVISVPVRQRLSNVLGSACNVFVTRPA